MLTEANRDRLTGIIVQMKANKEPESNILFVVDDFKKKYDPDLGGGVGAATEPAGNPLAGGASVSAPASITQETTEINVPTEPYAAMGSAFEKVDIPLYAKAGMKGLQRGVQTGIENIGKAMQAVPEGPLVPIGGSPDYPVNIQPQEIHAKGKEIEKNAQELLADPALRVSPDIEKDPVARGILSGAEQIPTMAATVGLGALTGGATVPATAISMLYGGVSKTETKKDLINAGVPENEAEFVATLAGASEAGLEFIFTPFELASLRMGKSATGKAKQVIKNKIVDFVKSYVGAPASEYSEEVLQGAKDKYIADTYGTEGSKKTWSEIFSEPAIPTATTMLGLKLGTRAMQRLGGGKGGDTGGEGGSAASPFTKLDKYDVKAISDNKEALAKRIGVPVNLIEDYLADRLTKTPAGKDMAADKTPILTTLQPEEETPPAPPAVPYSPETTTEGERRSLIAQTAAPAENIPAAKEVLTKDEIKNADPMLVSFITNINLLKRQEEQGRLDTARKAQAAQIKRMIDGLNQSALPEDRKQEIIDSLPDTIKESTSPVPSPQATSPEAGVSSFSPASNLQEVPRETLTTDKPEITQPAEKPIETLDKTPDKKEEKQPGRNFGKEYQNIIDTINPLPEGEIDRLLKEQPEFIKLTEERTRRELDRRQQQSERRKKEINTIDSEKDLIQEAVAKTGGLDYADVKRQWGTIADDIYNDNPFNRKIFGKTVINKNGKGNTIDRAAELLSQEGYLTLDENGKWDNNEFYELLRRAYTGERIYSRNSNLLKEFEKLEEEYYNGLEDYENAEGIDSETTERLARPEDSALEELNTEIARLQKDLADPRITEEQRKQAQAAIDFLGPETPEQAPAFNLKQQIARKQQKAPKAQKLFSTGQAEMPTGRIEDETPDTTGTLPLLKKQAPKEQGRLFDKKNKPELSLADQDKNATVKGNQKELRKDAGKTYPAKVSMDKLRTDREFNNYFERSKKRSADFEEWVKTAPDIAVFTGQDGKTAYIVSEHLTSKDYPWRTSYLFNRNGEWIPGGHTSHRTKLQAYEDADSSGIYNTDIKFSLSETTNEEPQRTDSTRTTETGVNYTPEIRAEHRRHVQTLAEALAAETLETGKEIDAAHDEGLYNDPEFHAISQELKAEGIDLIPIQSKLLNAVIHGDRIFIASPKGDLTLKQSVAHELSHLRDKVSDAKKAINILSKAFVQYRNALSRHAFGKELYDRGARVSIEQTVKEIYADLRAGVEKHYGVTLAEALRKGEKVETISVGEKAETTRTADQTRGPPEKYRQGRLFSIQQQRTATFYSKLLEAAQGLIPTKAQSVINWLRDKAGVKPVEIQEMGVEKWIADNQKDGRIDPKALRDYLAENSIVVEEKKLGEKPVPDGWTAELSSNGNYWTVYNEKGIKIESGIPRDEYLSEQQAIKSVVKGRTMYHRWQLPGGSGYVEVLLTLPTKNKATLSVEKAQEAYEKDKSRENYKRLVDARKEADRTGSEWEEKGFTGGHFQDTKNILGWFRGNFRTDADGKKVFFIEEVQSDWGQKGKKEGYRPIINKSTSELNKRRLEIQDKGLNATQEEKQEWVDIMNTLENKGVPSFPFRDNWHELTMKKALRYAIENGAERVAWTTGEQQIDRYEEATRQNVDRISWSKSSNGTVDIRAYKGERGVFSEDNIEEKRLVDLIGKNMAAQIASSKENGGVFEGKDLHIGGEGMVEFYDRKLPAFMQKYINQNNWGAKVENIKLGADAYQDASTRLWHVDNGIQDTEHGYKTEKEALEKAGTFIVHSFDITPAMKNDVLYKGQPLFSLREQPERKKPAEVTQEELDEFFEELTKGKTDNQILEETELPPKSKETIKRISEKDQQKSQLAKEFSPVRVALRRLLDTKALTKYGKEGKEIFDKKKSAERWGDEKQAPAIYAFDKAIKNFTKEDFKNFFQYAKGLKEAPEHIRPALEAWDRIRKDIAEKAQEFGLKVKKISYDELGNRVETKRDFKPAKDYYPDFINFDKLEKILTDHKAYDAFISEQAQKCGMPEAMVAELFEMQIKNLAGIDKGNATIWNIKKLAKKYGHLERPKITDLFEDLYTRDPRLIIDRYIYDSYMRLGLAKEFGGEWQGLDKIINKSRLRGGNYLELRELAQRGLGMEQYNESIKKLSTLARSIMNITKLSLSPITNLGDITKAAVRTNTMSAIRGAIKGFSKEGKEFSKESGVTRTTLEKYAEDTGLSASRLNQLLYRHGGFEKSEEFLRGTMANAAKSYLDVLYGKLKKNPKNEFARRRIEQFGLNPDELIKNGIKQADYRTAAQQAIRDSQPTSTLDMPYYGQSPLGKMLYQYKTFAFKATEFTKKFVVDELRKGNPAPLINTLIWGIALGEGLGALRALVRGRDPEDRESIYRAMVKGDGLSGYIKGIFNDLFIVGSFGLAGDFINVVFGYNAPLNTAKWFVGPTYSDIIDYFILIPVDIQTAIDKDKEFVYFTKKHKKGQRDFKTMKKLLYSMPFAGPALAQWIFPSRAKYQQKNYSMLTDVVDMAEDMIKDTKQNYSTLTQD